MPALADGYTVNALNQITGRENNTVTVSGTVNAAAGVIVNGQLAGRQGAFWSGEALPANTAGPVYQNMTVKAAIPGTPDRYATATRQTYVAADEETLTYDLDGNLLTDGRWVYQWDAENRLKQMETSAAAIAAGLPGRRITFAYDYQGRRIAKRVYSKSGSTWTSIAWTKFIYDGWNVIAELNASSSNSLVRTYAWGLDLGGSLHGMGGIGAMVRMVDHTPTTPVAYNPGYDGSGNVGMLMDSSGVVAAAYEYGPFGEPLRKQGSYAAANPWRYSGKYTDDESGLVYYGHRYYSPALGRFINRDPIGEEGGANLYGFVGNDPVNHWDYLGLTDPDNYISIVPLDKAEAWQYIPEIGFEYNPGEVSHLGYLGGRSPILPLDPNMQSLDLAMLAQVQQARVASHLAFLAGQRGGTVADLGIAPNSVTTGGGTNVFTVVDVASNTVGAVSAVATGTAQELQAAGQFAMNGNVYKAGFYGNQYVSSSSVAAAKSTQATLATAGKLVTAGGAVLGVGLAGVDVYRGGASNQSLTRGAIGVIGTASAFIPVVGPFVALGISVTNAAGGFDWLYNRIDNTPRFGNRPGQPGGGG